jgi:hypothetical protein
LAARLLLLLSAVAAHVRGAVRFPFNRELTMLEGTYRAKSGQDVEYQVEFSIEGNTIVWSGRARLHGTIWTDIPGGVSAITDPDLVEDEAHAVMHAAIEKQLRGEAG